MIAESLAGKRIAITGSTGFVGTALVERLLRGVPDCELILLVRDGQRTPAAARTERELLKNDAFDRLRETHDRRRTETFDEMTARRITTVAGDVSRDGLGLNDDDRATVATADIIIHSAAAVSFDSPLDSRGRDQPARPDPDRRPLPRDSASRLTSSPSAPATSPATGAATPRRNSSARARSTSV